MKRLLLAMILVPVLLTGCTRHYIMTLNNGTHLAITGKPRLEGSVYVYKDANGQPVYVPLSTVHEVAPASMGKPRYYEGFKSDPSQ